MVLENTTQTINLKETIISNVAIVQDSKDTLQENVSINNTARKDNLHASNNVQILSNNFITRDNYVTSSNPHTVNGEEDCINPTTYPNTTYPMDYSKNISHQTTTGHSHICFANPSHNQKAKDNNHETVTNSEDNLVIIPTLCHSHDIQKDPITIELPIPTSSSSIGEESTHSPTPMDTTSSTQYVENVDYIKEEVQGVEVFYLR